MPAATARTALDAIERLRGNIERVFIGNREAVDRLVVCLLARGHILIEDVPGVGKTVLATALAKSIDCSFSRIQLTPDMLPSDVLGVSIYDRDTGVFNFKRGPIFAHIVLADEVNRTTPRTQAALLESMNEATVSVEGKVLALDQPFIVIATQNPYEFEGTYMLPENQLDRFLMQIHLGYPSPADEARVIETRPGEATLHNLGAVLSREDVLRLQSEADRVRLDRTLVDYIIAIATATRSNNELQIGLSPRGTVALSLAARATALLNGRDYCIPEDVYTNVEAVAGHRVVPRAAISNDSAAGRRIIADVMRTVPAPV
ncbi:MAG TPA: MoxR family ATPase [Phycisphaerales bacterium]|nr:MoxR family ATPase [Phycisphaerales bacterium]